MKEEINLNLKRNTHVRIIFGQNDVRLRPRNLKLPVIDDLHREPGLVVRKTSRHYTLHLKIPISMTMKQIKFLQKEALDKLNHLIEEDRIRGSD